MNKLVALMLLFAVPAFAQQQVSLTPAAEQPKPAAAVEAAQADAMAWKPVLIGTAAAVTVAIIVGVIAAVVSQSYTPLRKSDFSCNSGAGCDGWVNQPPSM